MGAAVTRPVRVAHITTIDLTLRSLLLGQMRRLRDEGFEVVGISAPGPWVDDLRAEGFRHIPWPSATRSWDPGADLRAARELVSILRRERFDLVHTHNPKPGILGRVIARAVGVPRVVNTVHGLYATPEDRAARRVPVLAVEAIASRFSDLELYQSEEDLSWAKRVRVVRSGKAVLLGNGTDLSEFSPDRIGQARRTEIRAELGIARDAVVVGAVGRLVAEKGYRELLVAAADVRRRHPGARFLIVGAPDPEKADSITEAETRAAGSAAVFAGWRTDVADLMGAMDVFVLPSWREGVPRSAIEAAAAGLPLVVTDIRGCREVVRDGIEGILVPVRDPERLAAAIDRLVSDPKLRAQMGTAARRRAEDRFDERRVSDIVVERYLELLGRTRRGGSRPGLLPARKGTDGAVRRHDPVRLRRARAADARALARLHRSGLPDSFLPTLGEAFLRRLYLALADDPRAVTLVAEAEGRVVGFVSGVMSVRGFYRRFALRHGIQAAFAASPALAKQQVRRRVIETASYPIRSRTPTDPVPLPDAELLSIAVSPDSRSSGVGRALAGTLLAELGRRGVPDVKVVVAESNIAGNALYERVGFTRAGAIAVHGETRSTVWVARCGS
jgi:glycosyltransferase involved in cell wall biosynthesis/ribosomal protein S18 acetylase RimI-like enzyme